MGLLKMFGAGGGKLDVILDRTTVEAGGMLSGRAVYEGGKRAQVINDISLSVDCTTWHTEQTPSGTRRDSDVMHIVPKSTIANRVQVQPGARHEFRFAYNIPAGAYNSDPGDVEYSLQASADIDGEVDPGDREKFNVVGGQQYVPQAAGMSGKVSGQVSVGENALAQWSDGNWYAARVTNFANGMYGVDWHDPKLGGSMWVQQHQIRPMAGAPMQPAPMMQQPMMQQPAGKAPFAQGQAVLAQWTDGNWHPGKVNDFRDGWIGVDWDNPKLGAASWLQANQVQAAPAKGPAQFAHGQLVVAQWTDGGWYPGRVNDFRDGWIGVDWENPKLGASTWLQAHQIRPR